MREAGGLRRVRSRPQSIEAVLLLARHAKTA